MSMFEVDLVCSCVFLHSPLLVVFNHLKSGLKFELVLAMICYIPVD